MRIVFMGTPEFAARALAQLIPVHDVAAVYCQPPRPAGRGQQPQPSAVETLARAHGMAVCTPKALKDKAVQEEFAAWGAEAAVVAAYGLILPAAILTTPQHGCFNIHASLLPRWRGAAPIQRAIMAGDAVTGITIMQMDAGLDTGPMLLQSALPITAATTSGVLHNVLADLGATLILRALEAIAAGSLQPRPQPDAGVTYAAKIDKGETHIDFDRPAEAVARHIHGLSPRPGAWFAHGNERIKAITAEIASGSGPPGIVLDDQLTVACAQGAVRLLSVQRAGRAPAQTADFLRGYALPKATPLA